MAAPGLEVLAAGELAALGITPGPVESGGVSFIASPDCLMRANLELRTASRVLVRIGGFGARALGELERKASGLPWGTWLSSGLPLDVRVTSRKSRLYHRGAIAERMLRACGGKASAASDPDREEESDVAEESQLLVVRLLRDEVTVSLDSSGALLHRRGYRLAGGKAPLRETLAAAMLLAMGWDGTLPLLDPFCGSGTILIEAALLSRDIAPGLRRRFAFERWPGFDRNRWEALRAAAEARIRPAAPSVILGRDRDQGAIRAAVANAGRAGVTGDVRIERGSLSTVTAPADRGVVVSNPPYGVRTGDLRTLRRLYERLGAVSREALPGWEGGLLLPPGPLERATGLEFATLFETTNGGRPVRLRRWGPLTGAGTGS